MAIKVCKFGGTSMADARVMRFVAEKIVLCDESRRFVVVSAPGKRFSQDIKVTDLLFTCNDEVVKYGKCESFAKIRERFTEIVRDLGIDLDIQSVLDETEAAIVQNKSADFAASRGEYLSARIMAKLMNAEFVDATELVRFDEDGFLDEKLTYTLTERRLAAVRLAVVPGFYGLDRNGNVKTFSRGGSDITGAILARSMRVSVYENWTDVSGFYACDPRIVENPEHIKSLSYKELRELSYSGANVLHSDCIIPVREMGIPINIRNTFSPEDEGTMIMPSKKYEGADRIVTGIAGKKDFTVVFLEHSLMNQQIGFALKVMTVLHELSIPFEHLPTGIDTMSLVIESSRLKGGKLEKLLVGINEALHPDVMRVVEDVAMIATVGHGMRYNVGTAGRLFRALSESEINVRMIDQGSSELNIIVGVDNADMNRAIGAIYNEFFNRSGY